MYIFWSLKGPFLFSVWLKLFIALSTRSCKIIIVRKVFFFFLFFGRYKRCSFAVLRFSLVHSCVTGSLGCALWLTHCARMVVQIKVKSQRGVRSLYIISRVNMFTSTFELSKRNIIKTWSVDVTNMYLTRTRLGVINLFFRKFFHTWCWSGWCHLTVARTHCNNAYSCRNSNDLYL